MTAYNIINPATLVAGQPEDITQVLSNFQAIANVINGNLDNANLSTTAAINPSKILLGANGQILQSLGAAVGWGMKITTSPMSGGPPASPADGDIWIATNVDSSGLRWQFQYAAAAPTYKWAFIGGSMMQGGPSGTIALATTQTTPIDVTGGPTITIPRSGIYDFAFGADLLNGGTFAGVYVLFAQLYAGAAAQLQPVYAHHVGSAWQGGNFANTYQQSLGAGTVLNFKTWMDRVGSNSSAANCWVQMTPLAII
jgi:hypothetical protein